MEFKIGSLTFGRPATAVAVLEHPKPEPFVAEHAENLDDYLAVANKIGFTSGALLHRQLLNFLRREEISIYNSERVARYLDALVLQERKRRRVPKLQWLWLPLRRQDVKKVRTNVHWYENGAVSEDQYNRPVPLSTLRIVSKIAAEFPQAHFFVSDYQVGRPDPFLAVAAPDVPLIIVDVWDEPDFRLAK